MLDHVVTRHIFEISLIWTTNNSLEIKSKFGCCSNMFLVEPWKIHLDSLYEGHVLFLGRQYMVDPFHPCWIEPPNTWCGQCSVRPGCHRWCGNPSIQVFWDYDDVRNPFIVDPKLNGTEVYPLVGGCGPSISMSKQLVFPFFNVVEELLIVNLIVCGAVVQVDIGGI